MSTYTVTFDRLGRTHEPPALTITTTTDAPHTELAAAIYDHARPFLVSRDVEVAVNSTPEPDGSHKVLVFAGVRAAGTGYAKAIV